MPLPGGQRPRFGRKPGDTVRATCSIPRPVYNELVRSERKSGTYRTRIAVPQFLNEHSLRRAQIVSEPG
jgi:hypothetical protein